MNKRIVFIGHSIINGYPLSRNQCFVGQLISGSPYETVDLNNTYRQFGQFIDGLHPTAAGHRFMANIILEYIKSKGVF